MEGTVLLAAGAIFLLSKQYSKRKNIETMQQIEAMEAGVDFYKVPTQAPYIDTKNGNLYLEETRKAGRPPIGMTFGPKGCPNYYFHRPGGRGYYVLNTY
jgi:hypothetical protein